MADPLKRPLKWSKHYQIYAEQHNIYGVFGELLKQIIISKPMDPLKFIREKLPSIAKGINSPRVLLVGETGKKTGKQMAQALEAKFLTMDDVMKNANIDVHESLLPYLSGEDDNANDELLTTLCALVKKRISAPDCETRGYILSGFPHCKRSAIIAQQEGILPKNVCVFLPELNPGGNGDSQPLQNVRGSKSKGKSAVNAVQLTESMLALRKKQHAKCLDVASAYRKQIVKIIPAERVGQSDLLNELLGPLLTLRPTAAPFVPRIIILGGPCSGKTTAANHISTKFSLVNVNWVELIRGAARWTDEIAVEAEAYLKEMTPMKEESIKKILSKRLGKADCEKKGWTLRGFPESRHHCKILQDLCLEPNRVFVLSCNRDISLQRMEKKRESVLKRHLDGFDEPEQFSIDVSTNVLLFPYSEYSVEKRFGIFSRGIKEILPFFSQQAIFVDAAMKPSEVRQFVEASVVRPPLPHASTRN